MEESSFIFATNEPKQIEMVGIDDLDNSPAIKKKRVIFEYER